MQQCIRYLGDIARSLRRPRKSLLELPQELLLQIARQAHSLGDVRALLLTCRQCARLYRRFIYELDINHGYGVSLLYAAAHNQSDVAVKALVQGIDVNWTISATVEAATHLHCLSELEGYPHSLPQWTALQVAAYCNSMDVVRILVDAGADLGAGKDSQGRSALHLSITSCSIDICRFLIERRADVLARDAQGVQPLHYAAITNRGSRMVEMLLRAGAPIEGETTGPAPSTPLYMAIQYGCFDGVKPLLYGGAHIPDGLTGSWDALMFAATSSTQEVTNAILQIAEDNQQAHDYAQCLEIACSKGWTGIVELIIGMSRGEGIVQDVIKRYKNPLKCLEQYARSTDGVTVTYPMCVTRGYMALFSLVRDTSRDTVAVLEILLKYNQVELARKFCEGRRLNSKGDEEDTPLMIALTTDRRAVAAFLRVAQAEEQVRDVEERARDAERRKQEAEESEAWIMRLD